MRDVVRAVLLSPHFTDPASYFARYSWPVEFVARALKEVGWLGFSVNDAVTPLVNMGQQLFEPPDVAGWELGPAWISTSSALARMNFASLLANNQKFNLRDLLKASQATGSPDSMLGVVFSRLSPSPFDGAPYGELLNYVRSTAWTGSDTQLVTKAAGLVHLIVGAGEYQFN
jgi:hypothetical protein